MNLTELSSGTCYDFYVQDICGPDSSVWTGPYNFCTKTVACDDAGTDASGSICDTVQVDLTNYLTGADTGGVWVDADGTGALNGSVFDASASSVTFNMTYDFHYIIEATADCVADTATISITVDSCKGSGIMENLLSRSLEIYPNPTSRDVNISFETRGSEDAQIQIMDFSGKVIYTQKATNLNGRYDDELSLKHLAKGTYLLRVESGNLKAIRRIVKQ